MILKILKFPNEGLRKQTTEFNFINSVIDPVQLEKDLIDTMLANDGIGLAATQVGINARVFVIGHRDNPDAAQAFFNPVVMTVESVLEELEEGCLSFPGIYVKIKRLKKIRARWQNAKGEYFESDFENYDCRCFLHELDHLEGVVFQDRISPLKWAIAAKKHKKETH